jgi:hypothetical protein
MLDSSERKLNYVDDVHTGEIIGEYFFPIQNIQKPITIVV